MKMLIEAFVSTILIALAVFVCASFINVELQINQVKDFQSTCIGQIETSNFDPAVTAQCQAEAARRGYTLSLNMTKNEEFLRCQRCNKVFSKDQSQCPTCHSLDNTVYAQDRLAVVNIKYKTKIPLLNIEREGVLHGYAR